MRTLDFDAAREPLAKLKMGNKEYIIMEPILENILQVEQMRLNKSEQMEELRKKEDYKAMSLLEWEIMKDEISILIPKLPKDLVMKMTVRQRKQLLDILNTPETKGGDTEGNPPDGQE